MSLSTQKSNHYQYKWNSYRLEAEVHQGDFLVTVSRSQPNGMLEKASLEIRPAVVRAANEEKRLKVRRGLGSRNEMRQYYRRVVWSWWKTYVTSMKTEKYFKLALQTLQKLRLRFHLLMKHFRINKQRKVFYSDFLSRRIFIFPNNGRQPTLFRMSCTGTDIEWDLN